MQSVRPPGQSSKMDIIDLVNLRQAQRLDMYNLRPPRSNGAVQNKNHSRHRNGRFKDVVEWQFRPTDISMGTMVGNVFVQVSTAAAMAVSQEMTR
jgi:hypothetical protein